jgi:hypothetical protein
MFLHLLTEPQQIALLALAKQFVEADEKLSDEEHNLLEMLLAESGLPFDVELPDGDIPSLAAPLDNRQVRAAAVLEIIGIGHADGTFCAPESEFVKTLAGKFDIDNATVAKMDEWVVRQMNLAQEARQFWADDSE